MNITSLTAPPVVWPASWAARGETPPPLDVHLDTLARVSGGPVYRSTDGLRLPVGLIQDGVLTVPDVGRWCTVSVEREVAP